MAARNEPTRDAIPEDLGELLDIALSHGSLALTQTKKEGPHLSQYKFVVGSRGQWRRTWALIESGRPFLRMNLRFFWASAWE